MPIRPENVGRYPSNWPAIRAQILERAGNRCEWCGVPNHEIIFRDDAGRPWRVKNPISGAFLRRVKIVLTVAHLDHTPENCDLENLRALCQRCHNVYDREARAAGRAARAAAGQSSLDLGPPQVGKP